VLPAGEMDELALSSTETLGLPRLQMGIAVPPVLPTERIAHPNYGRGLPRGGISIQPMSQMGQNR